jgi:hypothetical protein
MNALTEQKLLEDFGYLVCKQKQTILGQYAGYRANCGKYISSTGMKSFYIGAFTKAESEFIQSFMNQKNRQEKVLYMVHSREENGLVSKKDIHLFCGSSFLGTFRVDVNEKSTATHLILVQEFFRFAIKNKVKFDLIVIDPPYNKRYDLKYNTHDLNNIDDGGKFLAWIVQNCIKILNYDGIFISKNWRSIRPMNSKFLAGMLTSYGGFRRATLLEAWQYIPNKKRFTFNMLSYMDDWELNNVEMIDWFFGSENEWTEREQDEVYNQLENVNNGLFISRKKEHPFKLPLKVVTPEEFIETAFKWDFKKGLVLKEKYDLIILDECTKVGGAIALSNALKKLIPRCLNENGVAFLKTYFNPVLEQLGLELVVKQVICYDNYGKINMLHGYIKQ